VQVGGALLSRGCAGKCHHAVERSDSVSQPNIFVVECEDVIQTELTQDRVQWFA
jgi:hypothetical protein